MGRLLILIYGLIAYLAFLAAILYAIGFVGDFVVPKTVSQGGSELGGHPIVINVLLLAVFAVQHAVMARPAFKQWWTQFIPKPIERSTFVLCSSLILGLVQRPQSSGPR